MILFQYPKDKHKRSLAPRQFKRYQSYKRYLQTEFERVCVYCRQPDTTSPNLNFGVDHYRPKGIRRFAHLICAYENLYYCCGSCNSRKSNDWPIDEKRGPNVVNPCDYEMAAHLRFDSKTGRMEPRSADGQHTEDLLQLNDDESVQFRLTTLRTVGFYRKEIDQNRRQLAELEQMLRKKKINQQDFDAAKLDLDQEWQSLTADVATYTGQVALPALHKQRRGVALLS